jgi:hypothetical protein
MFLLDLATLRKVIAAEVGALARPNCGLTTGCSGRSATRPAAEPERWTDTLDPSSERLNAVQQGRAQLKERRESEASTLRSPIP